MHEKDLALNDQQWLVWYKTEPNQITKYSLNKLV